MAEPAYRLLTAVDIPGAQRLRALASWNQTDRDWQNLIRFDPEGCFGAEMDGKLVGTATTTRFKPRSGPGSVAWVGMVLVDPEYRRHGIGSSLLKKCIAHLQAAGVETVKLDATPMGRPVYEKLGFVAEYELERWEGIARAQLPKQHPGISIAAISSADLADICAYDLPIFGTDRGEVLHTFWKDCSEISVVARSNGQITGYALSRPGTKFHQIGPLLADTPEIAEPLLIAMLSKLTGKELIIDIVVGNNFLKPLLERRGLKHQRPFLRMALGPNTSPGDPTKISAICCPELG